MPDDDALRRELNLGWFVYFETLERVVLLILTVLQLSNLGRF